MVHITWPVGVDIEHLLWVVGYLAVGEQTSGLYQRPPLKLHLLALIYQRPTESATNIV